MPATDYDRAGLGELLRVTKRRLQELEARAAFYGASADPSLTMEIADLRVKVADLEHKLRPPGQIPDDVWQAMTPDDQRRYLIRLVMDLEADFVACRIWLSRRVQWGVGVVIALEVLNVVLRWWPI